MNCQMSLYLAIRALGVCVGCCFIISCSGLNESLSQELPLLNREDVMVFSWFLDSPNDDQNTFFLQGLPVGVGEEGASKAIDMVAKSTGVDCVIVEGPLFLSTGSGNSLPLLPGMPEIEKRLVDLCSMRGIRLERSIRKALVGPGVTH